MIWNFFQKAIIEIDDNKKILDLLDYVKRNMPEFFPVFQLAFVYSAHYFIQAIKVFSGHSDWRNLLGKYLEAPSGLFNTKKWAEESGITLPLVLLNINDFGDLNAAVGLLPQLRGIGLAGRIYIKTTLAHHLVEERLGTDLQFREGYLFEMESQGKGISISFKGQFFADRP